MQKIKTKKHEIATFSISKKTYTFKHILFGIIISFASYQLLAPLFSTVPYHSFIWILMCYIVMLGIVGSIGVLFELQTERPFMEVLYHLFSGLYLHMLFHTQIYNTYSSVRFLLFFGGSYTALNLLQIWCHKSRHKDNLKTWFLTRSMKSLEQIQKNLGIISITSMCIIIVLGKLTTVTTQQQIPYGEMQTFNRNGYPVNEYYDDQYKLKENLDTIKLIRDNSTFQSLTYSEKCDVVKAVILCEARYLGLCEIQIEFDELPDNTLGQYTHGTHTITINSIPLKDGSLTGGTSDEVLTTCLHESRHCYQHLMAELYANISPEQRNLYTFKNLDVDLWIENINNYYPAGNDHDDPIAAMRYLTQPLELDARGYADSEKEVYYEAIDELLEEKE